VTPAANGSAPLRAPVVPSPPGERVIVDDLAGASATDADGETAALLPPADELDEAGGRLVAREKLVAALDRSGWVQAKAARLLGLTPRQLGYAIRKHGIEVQKF
jgi:Nif-specific regulatory protein